MASSTVFRNEIAMNSDLCAYTYIHVAQTQSRQIAAAVRKSKRRRRTKEGQQNKTCAFPASRENGEYAWRRTRDAVDHNVPSAKAREGDHRIEACVCCEDHSGC